MVNFYLTTNTLSTNELTIEEEEDGRVISFVSGTELIQWLPSERTRFESTIKLSIIIQT